MNEVKDYFEYYSKHKRDGDFYDEVIDILSEKKGIWILVLSDAGSLSIQSNHFTEQ